METTLRRPGNLPAEISGLVGRATELSEIARLIDGSPLVTLTGVAGVGKTRLALEVGRRCDLPDGVWLADLSTEQSGDLLAHGVSAALGLGEQAVRPQHEVLAERLADKRLLLILDTCDHLIEACATMVEEILRAAPHVRILVAGRQPLGLPGERVHRVDPLAVPPPGAGDLERYDSVRLLTQRAAALSPGFTCTEAVGRLCRRVEGIPLAIEFAARRLRALSAEQLADRLDEGFAVLDPGGWRADTGRGPIERTRRAIAGRHQTLRTAVGWSHELSTPPERLLWARLSVFAGSFDTAAAVAVCSDHRLGDVPATLARLVDKSIVTMEKDGCRMLEAVRGYGAMWLRDLGEEDTFRRRHYDHYRNAAESADVRWPGPDQLGWTTWAHREIPNLRAAIDRTLEGQEGLELVTALWFLWFCLGQIEEGRRYLDEVLANTPRPSAARTRALWVSGWIALAQGDLATAADRSDEALHAAIEQRDEAAAGSATHIAAVLSMICGDLGRAEELTLESIELFGHAAILDIGLPFAQTTHGLLLSRRGDVDGAVGVLQAQRAWCERHGDVWARSYGDLTRSQVELSRGRLGIAEQYVRSALTAKLELGDSLGSALALDQMAAVAAAGGEWERSACLLGVGQRIWTTFERPQFGSPVAGESRHVTERRARTMIGDALYEAAFTTGAAMDLRGIPD